MNQFVVMSIYHSSMMLIVLVGTYILFKNKKI